MQYTAFKKIVLNRHINNTLPSVIKLNPPYDMLVDLTKISTGRVEHTLHELLNHLLESPDDATSMLDDLRKACTAKVSGIKLRLKVVL